MCWLRGRGLVAASLLVGAVGCSEPAAQPAAHPAPPPPAPTVSPAPAPAPPAATIAPDTHTGPSGHTAPQAGTLLQRLMKSHFEQVAHIRAEVIAGNVDGAIEPARVIVEMQGVDTLPVEWRSSVRELQAAAARMRESPDLAEAAAATADIGMTCGGCHVVNGGPSIEVAKAPGANTTVAERMTRHLWASERLWEGLYGPSDAAWIAGAKAMAEGTLDKAALQPGGVQAKSLGDVLVSLGKRAQTTTDGERRAQIYASVLATCAPCHQAVRGKK